MENGFTSQFTMSVTTSPAGFLPTLRMAVKSTFIIMGVIMSQIRTAMGTLIWLPWPNSRPRRALDQEGTSFPRATPASHRSRHPQGQVSLEKAEALRHGCTRRPLPNGRGSDRSRSRTAALDGANEGAHEFAIHFRCDGIHIDSLAGKELAGVVDAVDARGFHVDLLEAGRGQLGAVFVLFERSGHASHPQKNVLRISGSIAPFVTTSETASRPPGFNTRKASWSTRSLSAERLMTQLEMMTSTELSGSGMLSICPFRNSTFVDPGLALVLFRQGEHLVGHVQAIGLARGADAPRGEKHVDAAARAEVEHDFSRIQPGERRGIAAAETGQHGGLGQLAGLSAP
jgi:hypothetical protein